MIFDEIWQSPNTRWERDEIASLRNQLLVSIMGTDPEPDQAFRSIPRKRTNA
jgi:hypothetical protein